MRTTNTETQWTTTEIVLLGNLVIIDRYYNWPGASLKISKKGKTGGSLLGLTSRAGGGGGGGGEGQRRYLPQPRLRHPCLGGGAFDKSCLPCRGWRPAWQTSGLPHPTLQVGGIFQRNCPLYLLTGIALLLLLQRCSSWCPPSSQAAMFTGNLQQLSVSAVLHIAITLSSIPPAGCSVTVQFLRASTTLHLSGYPRQGRGCCPPRAQA